MTYTCNSCEKAVDGFHECQKIIEEYTEKCGCKITIKQGFASLTSCYIEKFKYMIPCENHQSTKNDKDFHEYRKVGKTYEKKCGCQVFEESELLDHNRIQTIRHTEPCAIHLKN